MELRAEDVAVRYGSLSALDGVDLQLRPGEKALLLGSHGSGKTTLLKTLAGLTVPTRGALHWEGEDAWKLSKPERRRRQAGLGMVFQTDALFDSMSVLENVLLPLRRRQVPEDEALGRAREGLAAVGLLDAALRRPEQLSGGMKKRAGLARALVARPAVLLADDPLAGLDPATARQVADLLLRSSEGKSLLVCAPDPPPQLSLPRWIVLEAGRIRYDGPPLSEEAARAVPPGGPA